MNTTVNGDKTIVAWFKPNADPANGVTYTITTLGYTTQSVDYEIKYIQESAVTSVRYSRERYGVGNEQVNQNGVLGTANWHHIALVLSGTTLYGYFDGSEVNHITINTGNGSAGYYNGLYLGVDSRPGNYGSVMVDDVAIFNRALTAIEISNLYSVS